MGVAISLLSWQLLPSGSAFRPLTLRFSACHGTRLIGVMSARLAMISSTGAAVPAVDTPRSVAFGKRFLTQFSSPPPVK